MGGVNGFTTNSYEEYNGIDLTDCYLFTVEAGKEMGVYYNTSTQSNINAPKFKDGTKNVYYIAASENPTRISVYPKSGNGIASVKNGSTALASHPDNVFYYTSSLNKGEAYDVTIKTMDEVRCGTMTVTIDDPTDIRLQRKTSNATRTYQASDFSGNKLIVKYDPNTETDWTISHDGKKKIYKTTVNGTPAKRSEGGIYTSSTTISIQSYMPVNVSGNSSTVDVAVAYPNNNIPLKIAINPTEGSNDTDPTYLNDKITKVTVNGTAVDRSVWDNDNFTVKNGSTIGLTFESQLRGSFELGTAYLNDAAQTSRSSFLIESYDANPSKQTIKVDALVRNPLRYNIKSDANFDKFAIYFYSSPVNITSSDFNGTVHYSYDEAYIKPLYNSGYKVSSVKVNGQPVAQSSKDRYDFPASQDMKIEVTTTPYARDQKVNILADATGYGVDLTLDPDGSMYQRLELKPGNNEISVNAADFPIEINSGSPYVYLNDVRQEADENGYYLANYKVGDNVKILNRAAYNVTITYDNIDGTIYHDGKVVAGNNSYTVLQGTEIKVVPRSTASNLVLQTGASSFATKQADKSFVFYAQSNANVSLHPENPKVTVKLNTTDKDLYKQIRVNEGTNNLTLTSNTTELVLPYYADRSTYSLSIKDSKGIYEVKSISFSPSTGASFDASSQTASGVKGGMTLTVTLEKPDKPYKVDLTILTGNTSDYSINFNSSTGKWESSFSKANSPSQIILNTGSRYDSESGYEMPGVMMNYGVNNPKTVIESYYNSFAYSAEEVEGAGVSLTNLSGSTLTVFENYYYHTVTPSYDPTNPDKFYLLSPYESARSVTGKIFVDANTDQASPLSFDTQFCQFMWSVDGGEYRLYSEDDEVLNYPSSISYAYYWGGMDNNLVRLFHGSEIKIKPVDGENIKTVTLKGRYQDYEVKPDADGVYTIMISSNEQDLYVNYFINVEVKGDTYSIFASSNYDYSAIVRFDGDEVFDYLDQTEREVVKPASESMQFTCDDNYQITGAIDMTTGKELPFDPNTYTVSGLYDGIHLCIQAEPINRDKSMKIYYCKSTSSAQSPNLVRGAGKKAIEKVYNLYCVLTYFGTPSMTLNFSDLDLPMTLDNGTSTTPRSVFINDKQIAYDATTNTYAMPATIEDGSVMYIINSTSASSVVNYNIEEGIPVKVMHDTRVVANASTKFETVPSGTVIKVMKDGDYKYDYTIEYSVAGGDYKTLPTSGYAVVASKNVDVRVAKTYNTITVNGANGADLTALQIVADGETYTVAPGNNVIKVPTHVKSMTITTREEGKYVDAIDGLTFDSETGQATNIKSGTINVSVKEIERPMEVTVYVDSEDLTDGVLVLGNGKVIETASSIEDGYNTIHFSEEDLPIIYRISEFGNDVEGNQNVDPSQLPVVYVNGEKLEYSAEHGGYVFPVDALLSGEAPVIKIYPPTPQGVEEVAPVNLTYLVEPGISFKAIEDRVTEVKEAGMRSVLPGTEVSIEAKADNGDDIFFEVDGQRVTATDGKCTLSLGQSDMVISVKFEKLNLTLKSDEWSHVKISGAGLAYPMYDAVSSLEFPQKTSEFRLTSTVEGRRVTAVTDEAGNSLSFDPISGKLTGVKAGMTLNISLGDYLRNTSMMVYLEETVEDEGETAPISHLVLAPTTAVEKSIALNKGYQTVVVANEDLPLEVTTIAGVDATVFLNNEQIEMTDGGVYNFPAQLPANPIVKIFVARPEGIAKATVNYDFNSLKDYTISLTHDNMELPVDTKQTHRLLPGTEIRFTVKAKNQLKTMADETDVPFTVKVNGIELEPQQDGSYLVKVTDDHAISGLNIEVAQTLTPSSIDSIFADSETVDIYGINGVIVKKGATEADLNKLPAGFYIVNGTKMYVGNN